ncbi:16S rRNA (cytidine(1402)-2'-O)-methyltransferase [Ureibacillus sp. FSL K6-8385]|uniref:Ribosomal RNA small subunit methyltransferase I n=1 Tax=Ureibacillus terrenus TaxID=118246 RepID=A0A540UYB5_9BACL|nr:16S rRNA (cytidine(1402)-2'-O)-methyltransferase [Ureibacillus terrenus]MED3662453.1 16S rRNA (cytidine(1402)-2'-O)-methyltransferase [Ureibacillus terrenus]MED3763221.1 16S rRNA (cytidine(1402)-2'-O)-methyltransferase [Ureibacillus terrenus]TQE89490.1 16S rRNA (cytidine(1402)-2'-O)-methyltransferase [Ureibacillus terrenus]
MKSQKSSIHEQSGCLYLVGTPIGNLEDITLRALRILKEADIIAAEDTRNTKKLCHYYDISTPLVSYHEHNQEQAGEKILQWLREGKKVALVSDAGMPCISDPGADLVQKAVSEDIAVIPIPGANAALTALVASGLSPQPFYFFGFLNRNNKERKRQLAQLKNRKETLVFYEAPHRLQETLENIAEVLGNRRIVLARELTKKFEEFLRGTVEEALQWTKDNEIRGEFCIILEGAKENDENEEAPYWAGMTIPEHVEFLMKERQLSSKEAIKEVAKLRGLPKREVYQQYHL